MPSVACKPYMVSVIMLSVVMLSVVMLSVVAPFFEHHNSITKFSITMSKT
jgi:hypothetical protein